MRPLFFSHAGTWFAYVIHMRKALGRLAVLVASVFLLSSCATSRAPNGPSRRSAESTTSAVPRQADSSQFLQPASARTDLCPARSARARVRVEELERGAALGLTSDDVEAVRRAVATWSAPAKWAASGPRIDKVAGGVRLIFESDAATGVAGLRKMLHGHARELTRSCGLVPGTLEDSEQARAEPPSAPAPTPAPLADAAMPSASPSMPKDAAASTPEAAATKKADAGATSLPDASAGVPEAPGETDADNPFDDDNDDNDDESVGDPD